MHTWHANYLGLASRSRTIGEYADAVCYVKLARYVRLNYPGGKIP